MRRSERSHAAIAKAIGTCAAAMVVGMGFGCAREQEQTNGISSKEPAIMAEKKWPDQPLRGLCTSVYFSHGDYLDEATFLKLKDWNVNLIRVAIDVDHDSPWKVKQGDPLPPIPADDPLRPYAKHFQGLDIALELAAKHHIHVIPTIGDVVGRRNDVMYKNSDGEGFYGQVFDIWRHIAARHGSNPWLLAYDILNEPNGSESGPWGEDIAPKVVKAIREIDQNTYIVYEPAPWALPDQGFANLVPLDDPKMVYSFHFYYPHSYTHQGIHSYKGTEFEGKAYPGELSNFGEMPRSQWDKAALERSMANVIAFQQKHQVKIWVGEFSAIRWAPGAATWLQDAIDIFEKHGWSWTFHSYGSWNGWNPTFAAEDPQNNLMDGGKDTDRLQVLKKSWLKNERLR